MTRLTIPRFLDAPTCQRLIAEAESCGFSDAPVTTSAVFVMMPDLRNDTRLMFDDTARAGPPSRRARTPRVYDRHLR